MHYYSSLVFRKMQLWKTATILWIGKPALLKFIKFSQRTVYLVCLHDPSVLWICVNSWPSHCPLGFQIGLDVCLRIPFNLAANNLVPLWKGMPVVISGCLPCPPQRAANSFYLQTFLIVSLSPLGRYSNPNLRLYANKQWRPMQSQPKAVPCQRSAETCETHLVENKILDGKAWRLYWLSAKRDWGTDFGGWCEVCGEVNIWMHIMSIIVCILRECEI